MIFRLFWILIGLGVGLFLWFEPPPMTKIVKNYKEDCENLSQSFDGKAIYNESYGCILTVMDGSYIFYKDDSPTYVPNLPD